MTRKQGELEEKITESLNILFSEQLKVEKLKFDLSEIESNVKTFNKTQNIHINQIDDNEEIRRKISNLKGKIENLQGKIENVKKKIYDSLVGYHNLKINLKYGSDEIKITVEDSQQNADGIQTYRIKLNEDYL